MINRHYEITVPELLPFEVIVDTRKYSEKQFMLAEVKRNIKILNPVEIYFLNEVFDTDRDFEEVFNECEEEYNRIVDQMTKQKKFKRTRPVEDYFRKKYMTKEPLNGWTLVSKFIQYVKNIFKS